VDTQKRNSLFFGFIAGFLLVAGVGGNYYFSSESMFLRALVLLAIILLATFLFSKTIIGQKAWLYWKEALVEVRKVVWPTKKETIQSTVGVLVMVLVMGIFLWSVDAVLVRIVAWLLRHNGV